jgi:subtilisin family serine protease
LKTPVLLFAAALSLSLSRSFAAPQPAASDEPPTAREQAQGYREHLILARPRAAHRATVEQAEARDHVRVREKFTRFRDLRIIELDATDDADSAVARLQATGRYDFVEPDYLRHILVDPNDPQYASGALWALKNTGQNVGIAGADIKAAQAWDLIHDAPNVIVAVVDTGVNINHQDIAANIWRNPSPTFGDVNGARFINGSQNGNPADDNGHGTHVAGTIGAVGDNGIAIAGIAWRVQIMPIKVFPATGSGSSSDIVRGINYAVTHGAHIINASYGGIGTATGFSNAERDAIAGARDAGIIFVAAAGNDALDLDVSRSYPASHAIDNIVAVGASTRRDELATFSNYGAAVDLFAPGAEIISLAYNSSAGTTTMSGTSMAAPHVAGALALLKARFPDDTYRQLINRLLRGVDVGERFVGKAATNGRLNVFAALTSTSNRPANDDFASRVRYTNDNLFLRTSNAGATAEPGETPLADAAPAATLWWEWVAPSTGTVSVDTSGSGYDTVLAVYTGTALGALTTVATNDDEPSAATSRVTFTAQAGVTYQIAVGGKNGQTGLTILNVGTIPANDSFATPLVLSGQSLHLTATNLHSSREAGEPRIGNFRGSTSLWYRWTAPRTGRFQVSAYSAAFDPVLAVYTGTAIDALTPADPTLNAAANDKANNALWTLNATAGTTYMITVDTKVASAVGQFTLSLVDSLWQLQTGNAVTGSPAIAPDGTIYFGGTDRSLYAVSPNGAAKWTFATGSSIDTCSPAIAEDGTVYIGSNDGSFYAVNPDGTRKWAHSFTATVSAANSPALAADGTIYVKIGDGYLYALNPADGSQKWRFNLNGLATYGSPSIAPDGTIYQGSDDGKLYALNPDGTLKWAFTSDNDIYTVPAIDAAGNIYFGVLNSGKLFSVAPNGTKRWEYSGGSLGCSSSPCLSTDGATVYFGGYDARLHAVNTADGSARWTFRLGAEVRASSPAIDRNGVVYLGCYDSRLYAVNPDGALLRTWDMGDWLRSCPAIFGNTLYVGSNDYKLYAFDLAAGVGAGPWPQFRANARRLGRRVEERFEILSAPKSQVAVLGAPLTLSVTASSAAGAPTYEWRKDGTVIPGATSATYSISAVTAATAGSYTVTVTGPQGSLTSPAAIITVEAANPGRLTNLSVRTTAGADAQTLTIGFVMAGAPDKTMLIRAIGPSLGDFGVTGVLPDPRLQLFSGSTVLASNDNWFTPTPGTNTGAAIAAASTGSGAFALRNESLDAAILTSLSPGSYTAQITGASATGIALGELYDTAPASGARLTNVSARAQVGTGSSILIAGFSISGNVSKRVLIRGVGPGLAPFGVAGLLGNPRLDLYTGSTLIQGSDDWGGTSDLSAAFTAVGAFSLPVGSRDAALLVTLPPGTYTAQVSGVANTTGVALVEIYELP